MLIIDPRRASAASSQLICIQMCLGAMIPDNAHLHRRLVIYTNIRERNGICKLKESSMLIQLSFPRSGR